MKMRAYVAICLAAVTVGLAFFWNVRQNSVRMERTEVAPPADRPSERGESTTAEPDESVDPESGQAERTISEEAGDSALAKRQKDMEDGIYQLVGTSIVQSLTQSGLALSDSEEIARRLAADTAKCTMDSLSVEAERQSISADELLSQLQTTVRDGGSPFAVADLSGMNANAFPCQADAMQRAGMLFSSSAQASEEQIKKFMGCVAGFNDSDIIDRGVILEICTEEVFGEVP